MAAPVWKRQSSAPLRASSAWRYPSLLDAKTGALLWKFQTGAAIDASPISYAADGKQFVAVSSGNVVYSFALAER